MVARKANSAKAGRGVACAGDRPTWHFAHLPPVWEPVRQDTHRELAAHPNSHPNSLARDRLEVVGALKERPVKEFYSNQGIALTALRLPLGFNKAHSLFFEATNVKAP
jgi:hypothetical protein